MAADGGDQFNRREAGVGDDDDEPGAPNVISGSEPNAQKTQAEASTSAQPTPVVAQTRVEAMRTKLKAGGHTSPYRLRKQLPEPVFGQIKQARGFRQFLLRGFEKVRGEWSMICAAHNLLKLAQGRAPSAAPPMAA